MNGGSLGAFGFDKIILSDGSANINNYWWKIMSCVDIQYYSSTGTFTYKVPSSVTEVVVIVIGGGANGTSVTGGAASGCFAGFVKVEPDSSIPITVGASNGGTSSFGNYVTVTGGTGRTTPGYAVYNADACIPLISTTGGIGGTGASSSGGGGGGGIGGGNGGSSTITGAGGGGGGFKGNGADAVSSGTGGGGGGYMGNASATNGGAAIPNVTLAPVAYNYFKAWLTGDIGSSFTGGNFNSPGGFLGGGGAGSAIPGGFGGGGGGGMTGNGNAGGRGGGGGGGVVGASGGAGIVIVMAQYGGVIT